MTRRLPEAWRRTFSVLGNISSWLMLARDAGHRYSSSRNNDGDSSARSGSTGSCPVGCADDIEQTATVPHLRHMRLELPRSHGIVVRATCVSGRRPARGDSPRPSRFLLNSLLKWCGVF